MMYEAELRRVMRQGIWEDAAMLVTSDDCYRNKSLGEQFAMRTLSDKRIPLLLKLPRQKRHVKYETTFNSIIIHDVLLALLTNSASRPEEIIRFLEYASLRLRLYSAKRWRIV